MSKKRALIVLTRPQAQSERFAQMCREGLGVQTRIILSPLLKIELLPAKLPERAYDGLIFTSENGVRAYKQTQLGLGIPAYCVGERTAKAAKAAGLVAYSADGSADNLVAMVNSAKVAGPMLHIRGQHTRGDVAGRVTAEVGEVVAYRQTTLPLSDEAQAALQGDVEVILPLFSPRTAKIFFQQAGPISAPLQVISMSEAVNDAVLGSNNAQNTQLTVATAPDAQAMLSAIKHRVETF